MRRSRPRFASGSGSDDLQQSGIDVVHGDPVLSAAVLVESCELVARDIRAEGPKRLVFGLQLLLRRGEIVLQTGYVVHDASSALVTLACWTERFAGHRLGCLRTRLLFPIGDRAMLGAVRFAGLVRRIAETEIACPGLANRPAARLGPEDRGRNRNGVPNDGRLCHVAWIRQVLEFRQA